ncbi:FadR/GntR family transcriptional regulator [Corynebacterium glutamicum]|uniref:FadR/GntR family transcriptional regulator n=1 Tax=Corynebacterium glutamicum TaxID=1718 RepID=UPI000941D6E3|nr:FadR/GntR family transcriptional regulator [Corynebacterium glutamicum]OKX85370.1 GntR family transcriptional regulator [Corynebacterium glutamicum]
MSVKAHESVMDWVTEELRSGRLKLGDHLPSERSLSETLGVSRSSLREALRVLEALGTISTATGSGPRSGTIITAAPGQALSLSVTLQLITDQVSHHDIYETRQLLEGWAALHSSAERGDWDVAEALLEKMDDLSLPLEDFLRFDAEFHVVISKGAENPLISTLMEALRLSVADHTVARARALPDWPATSARLQKEHRAILAALRAGESTLAATLIKEHIEGYYQETAAAET